MKKVKFMLLSLILLAVVGAALAFKAKGPNRFCTVSAYYFDWPGEEYDRYYCQWDANGIPVDIPNAGPPQGTISCNDLADGYALPFGDKTVCVQFAGGEIEDAECTTIACNGLVRFFAD